MGTLETFIGRAKLHGFQSQETPREESEARCRLKLRLRKISFVIYIHSIAGTISGALNWGNIIPLNITPSEPMINFGGKTFFSFGFERNSVQGSAKLGEIFSGMCQAGKKVWQEK